MRGYAVRKCEKEVETWRDRWSAGSVAFDLERMNELEVFFTDDEADVQGFRTVNVTEPGHPYAGAWWPPGHILGYEHTFVHTMKDLMGAIKAGASPAPTFEDGYRWTATAVRQYSTPWRPAPRAASGSNQNTEEFRFGGHPACHGLERVQARTERREGR